MRLQRFAQAVYAYTFMLALGLANSVTAQHPTDLPEFVITGYLFHYDLPLKDSSNRVLPFLPDKQVLKSLDEARVSHLENYPPLKFFATEGT